MRLLVTILSRQTVVQASLIREAAPDVIIFVSTVMAAENDWHRNIPMLVKRENGEDIKYLNVFIEKNMNLGDIIEMLRRHVGSVVSEYGITEICCDASCGKGIHRILFAEYLKRFSEKHDLDFFLVYFDLDTRQINRIAVREQAFREYRSSVSIDWHLKERLTLYGAELTDFLTIYDAGKNYFAENAEQFEELYTNLCNSMNLRAFFSSYDNMKTIIDLKNELHEFMVKNNREEQIDKFLQRIFGVMPHLRPEINDAKNDIRRKITSFFDEMSSRKELRSFSDSFDFRTTLASYQKRFNAEMPDAVIEKILPLAGEIDKADLKSDVQHFLDVLFSKISEKITSLADVQNVEVTAAVFNRFKQKYVREIERESTLNTRSQISIIFEKLISYAVYRAIEKYPLLKESIASVYQNVKLSGKASSLIEIDTLVVFRNGYLHILEAKSSHVSNKDLNSRILVMKKYLGESVGMDIVFPFTARDIELFKEKNDPFIRKFYSKGLKSAAGWGTFFATTDKEITPIDKIAGRLLDLAAKYS